jgi:hypothetical protein
MQKNLNRQYFFIVSLLSLAIGMTIHFPMIMDYFFGEADTHNRGFMISFTHLGLELLITCIVAFITFVLNFFILKPVSRHNERKLLNIALAVALTILSVFILNHLLYNIKGIIDPQPQHSMGHRNENEFIYTNFFVSALVVACVLVIRLIFQKQTIMMENEELRREALQSQYESLRNQLSPHFLFNSLTALKVLIEESPSTAGSYVSSLSKALRYTLRSNERQLVALREEMEFMDSYLQLIRMRYDTNLIINMGIMPDHMSYLMPPLTIQTLVENAIKHNEISKRKPLTIDIITKQDGSLVVKNNIQAKLTRESGTGIGLTNLSRQFRLLLNKEISITKENDMFIVAVPLIPS